MWRLNAFNMKTEFLYGFGLDIDKVGQPAVLIQQAISKKQTPWS
jgi:hypoxanthine-guanine phosphoribosyltransferase